MKKALTAILILTLTTGSYVGTAQAADYEFGLDKRSALENRPIRVKKALVKKHKKIKHAHHKRGKMKKGARSKK